MGPFGESSSGEILVDDIQFSFKNRQIYVTYLASTAAYISGVVGAKICWQKSIVFYTIQVGRGFKLMNT